MSMSTVTVRVDDKTKQVATDVLDNLGLDVSTAVRMFLRQVVIRGTMPIELIQDPFYSEANQAALRASIKQLNDSQVVTQDLG
jgi:DNA-damage-inducible protein J